MTDVRRGRSSSSPGRARPLREGVGQIATEERLAKLSGGVAVVWIDARSGAEMKSRKEALEDAISATKAAAADRWPVCCF